MNKERIYSSMPLDINDPTVPTNSFINDLIMGGYGR